MVIVQTWDTMTNYYFVAIPLYIFMANVLQRSGVIEDLFTATQSGLAHYGAAWPSE